MEKVYFNNIQETGFIVSAYDGIIKAIGLENSQLGELIYVLKLHDEDGCFKLKRLFGLIYSLTPEGVGILFFGNTQDVFLGQRIHRTFDVLNVQTNVELLGNIVNSLGEIQGKTQLSTPTYKYRVERKGPGIVTRGSINEPLHTGSLTIDALFPIGLGQRELIIGNKQTGKSSIAVTAILSQNLDILNKIKKEYIYCVYVAIGQKKSNISKIYKVLKKKKCLKFTIIVAATADDSASLQFIAPFSGCTIAEFFRDRGKDALIIYDDLTKQAASYRQIALLLSRAPGREAYPGDIFYLHSRLLERSAKLSLKHMGGSLTALPIIETLDSDITAFIPTNVISITDGQIFTDEDLFLENIKPAVNVRLSVSRIGANAQTDPIKLVSKAFKQQLLNYERVKFFEIYDDLGPEISEQIHRGHRLLEVLKQGAFDPVKVETQLLLMSLAINGYFDNLQVMEVKNLKTWLKRQYSFLKLDFYKKLNLDLFDKQLKLNFSFLKKI